MLLRSKRVRNIKSALEELGVECVTPDLPDNVLARKKYWFSFFTDTLELGTNDVVIGHSSGALAILKYAEDHKIGASILVGAYYTDSVNLRDPNSHAATHMERHMAFDFWRVAQEAVRQVAILAPDQAVQVDMGREVGRMT